MKVLLLEFTQGPLAGTNAALLSGEGVLGRSENVDVQIPDALVSAQHLGVALLPDGHVRLRDLGSTHGSYVDGQLSRG